MEELWTFLGNAQNQATLEWVGAAVVAMGGAVWTALKVLGNRNEGGEEGEQGTGTPVPLSIVLVLGILALGLVGLGLFSKGDTITVTDHGVAARHINGSTVTIQGTTPAQGTTQ
ncbi:hypothetical protein [Rhodospirillum sp. A1_3_36]|uniref:hypothetical protein n=1 Tax=Rhodospirillum sp. A1_3_36 TaxID=3391666 RepID=UPI0039A755A6